jgi:hypothetical protein
LIPPIHVKYILAAKAKDAQADTSALEEETCRET